MSWAMTLYLYLIVCTNKLSDCLCHGLDLDGRRTWAGQIILDTWPPRDSFVCQEVAGDNRLLIGLRPSVPGAQFVWCH